MSSVPTRRQILKLEHSSPLSPSPFPWPGFFFCKVASNYHFKKDTKEHHCAPQTLSVFSLLLNLPSNSPQYIFLLSHIFSKPPSALPYPPISNPFFSPCLQIRVQQMYICGQGNICSYGKPPVQFDSNQPRSVMFAWHVQWNEEKHTNLIITDLRNGERARQLVFHHKLMQYHLSSDLFITLPLFWFSTSRFHQPFMRHL